MTLAEAVKKMTSLPAKKIGLKERGQLKEGFIADITLFNAADHPGPGDF
jgi:N-acyl-D-amino-acid deacylase